MAKAYGRKIKQKVGKILNVTHEKIAMDMLEQIPDKQLVGHLFSFFYNKEELIKCRSVVAMGSLVARMGKKNIERARIILRRIMWNLNDESGGIGWGSPEAMGEILYRSPKLAIEFKSILFSYINSEGNYIEHEMLQRGVLWGIGTYLKANPKDLDKELKKILFQYLRSSDSIKRVYALRALLNVPSFGSLLIPENITKDKHEVLFFKNWKFINISASNMVQQAFENTES